MNVQTPDWVKDAIFYQIFPDRFAKSDQLAKPKNLQEWGASPTYYAFQGGDLLGVAEKLDYLTDLGVTAIYFNPVFSSAANHRYHTFDYYTIDHILGGEEAFCAMLEAAHERGIRVVLDGVFNHVGRGFFQFHHLLEAREESPYTEWFHVHHYPLNAYSGGSPNYHAWWGNAALPKLNTSNPNVRELLLDVGEYWLKKGVDGWRLDVPNEIDDDSFWQEFRQRCKAINPEAYIVGEIWHDAQRWLQGDQFDGVMNYQFTRAAFGFFGGETLDQTDTGRCGLGYMNPQNGAGFLGACNRFINNLYHPEIVQAQLNMLTSHDTPRMMTIANRRTDTAQLLFAAQMTLPGAPNIYYGDEIGLEGGHDPDCRRAFPWDDEEIWNQELLATVKELIVLRKKMPALRRGTFTPLVSDGLMASYLREYEDETVLVAFNASNKPTKLVVPSNLKSLFGCYGVSGEIKAGETVKMPARSCLVWTNRTNSPSL
jgi:neopullulanase